jgi:transketolase
VAQGWLRYANDMLGVERFGASAPGAELLERYGFTVDNVCKRAKALLDRTGRSI